ncbi:superoxide dismutase [Patescibacteria group bacterium]
MFVLEKLPYKHNALEPYIDEQTMKIHHDKHYQAYINNLNLALEGYQKFQNQKINDLLANLNKLTKEIRLKVRNHGGGVANHSFYFSILKKNSRKPDNEVLKAINTKFSGFEEFKLKFSKLATSIFGSGWAWLVLGDKGLELVSTSNQDNPISQGKIPLLNIDVWEHAYYLQYQNKRVDYINAFFHVINWDKVNDLFLKAQKVEK